MMDVQMAGVLIAAFVASLLATRLLIGFLARRNIIDAPNHRSSHTVPTPRGGGIAPVAVIAAGLICLSLVGPHDDAWLVPVGAIVLLAAISFIDDFVSLSPLLRLVVHLAVICGVLIVVPGAVQVLPDTVPAPITLALIAVAWLWFVNLYNFMDGIDGILSVETICVCLGIWVVRHIAGADDTAWPVPLLVAAAVAGFAVWNRPPARIFAGDVGSVPLGFVVGWLLIELAAVGQLAAALILPGYYLADATITLFKRLLRGEKIWRAHREHFYQRAVQGGLSHAQAVWRIAAANSVLVGCAAAAASGYILAGSCGAVITVGILLLNFQRWSARALQ